MMVSAGRECSQWGGEQIQRPGLPEEQHAGTGWSEGSEGEADGRTGIREVMEALRSQRSQRSPAHALSDGTHWQALSECPYPI